MSAYQFMPRLPANSSVASAVTHVVSAWFLVAAGAILTDPPSVYTQRPTPAFRETITVSAQAEAAPVAPVHETITVVARRGGERRGVSL